VLYSSRGIEEVSRISHICSFRKIKFIVRGSNIKVELRKENEGKYEIASRK